jgi:hypothetical protein
LGSNSGELPRQRLGYVVIRRFFQSIQGRLILAMSLCALVAGGLIGGFSIERTKAFGTQQVEQNLIWLTQTKAQDMSQLLGTVAASVEAIRHYSESQFVVSQAHNCGLAAPIRKHHRRAH